MYIFIHFPKNSKVSRDLIEEEIDLFLDDKGEVVGGGTGENGSNIDVEIFEGEPHDYLEDLSRILKRTGAPGSTYFKIDGQKVGINK